MISLHNKLHTNELAQASSFQLLGAAFELSCLHPSLLVLRSPQKFVRDRSSSSPLERFIASSSYRCKMFNNV
ncbi:hypothetical protein [Nostoc sp.]|uniref:hypothetical protein n=1 Tax=Nostoc sp. TaxID=1180 RepID=UPI002FF6401D